MDQPAAPLTPPPKKGPSTLAIFGFGCGTLVVLAMIGAFLLLNKGCSMVKELASDFQKNPAAAAMKLALKGNPDLEIVKTDDGRKLVTIRDKKTGEETTWSFEDIEKGKFTLKSSKGGEMSVDASGGDGKGKLVVKGPDGEVVFGGDAAAVAPPAWVPLYPAVKVQSGGLRAERAGKISGTLVTESADGVAKVREFYETKLKADGYQTEVTTMNRDGADSAVVKGTKVDGDRHLNILINADAGKTIIILNYEAPKT